MLLVTVVCSDPDCAEEREVVVEDLDALEAIVCDCSHGFVVVAVSEHDRGDAPASVIELPRPRTHARRAA
jgi:hypothetical protein